MSWFPFAFEGPIERFGVGRSKVIWYNVLFLPPALVPDLPPAKGNALRVEGEIADVPIAGAFMPTGDGRRWILVSPKVFKGAGVKIGDLVEMRFRLDDPNRVEVPDALADALERDDAARARWEALTPGKRRGLAYMIGTAKTQATIDKRVASLLETLLAD